MLRPVSLHDGPAHVLNIRRCLVDKHKHIIDIHGATRCRGRFIARYGRSAYIKKVTTHTWCNARVRHLFEYSCNTNMEIERRKADNILQISLQSDSLNYNRGF